VKLSPKLKENIFLSDTILPHIQMKYEFIEAFVSEKDKQAVKKILQYGKVEMGSTKNLIAYLSRRVKLKQLNEFDSLQDSEPIISFEEKRVLSKIKSIDSLLSEETVGTEKYQLLKQEENKLFNSRHFKNYTKKVSDSQKRILIFFPVYKWKNMYLVVFNYLHSVTNSATFTYILK
jgi:hypothetical protein